MQIEHENEIDAKKLSWRNRCAGAQFDWLLPKAE